MGTTVTDGADGCACASVVQALLWEAIENKLSVSEVDVVRSCMA
jgi:hypothetical protein